MTANAGRPDLDHLIVAKHIPNEEPKFLLRARDPAAATAIRAWASAYLALGGDQAVAEQALQQADAMDAWLRKEMPGTGHLEENEARQLRYQFSRRAWRARDGEAPDESAIALAERRGWDAAMAGQRAQQRTVGSPDAWAG
jgi:hypothetical protein